MPRVVVSGVSSVGGKRLESLDESRDVLNGVLVMPVPKHAVVSVLVRLLFVILVVWAVLVVMVEVMVMEVCGCCLMVEEEGGVELSCQLGGQHVHRRSAVLVDLSRVVQHRERERGWRRWCGPILGG